MSVSVVGIGVTWMVGVLVAIVDAGVTQTAVGPSVTRNEGGLVPARPIIIVGDDVVCPEVGFGVVLIEDGLAVATSEEELDVP